MKKGCGVLFKNGSGIIICGEKRVDGNCFLCNRCLKNDLMELKDLRITQEFLKKKHIIGITENGGKLAFIIKNNNKLNLLSLEECISLVPEIKSFMEKSPGIIEKILRNP